MIMYKYVYVMYTPFTRTYAQEHVCILHKCSYISVEYEVKNWCDKCLFKALLTLSYSTCVFDLRNIIFKRIGGPLVGRSRFYHTTKYIKFHGVIYIQLQEGSNKMGVSGDSVFFMNIHVVPVASPAPKSGGLNTFSLLVSSKKLQ